MGMMKIEILMLKHPNSEDSDADTITFHKPKRVA